MSKSHKFALPKVEGRICAILMCSQRICVISHVKSHKFAPPPDFEGRICAISTRSMYKVALRLTTVQIASSQPIAFALRICPMRNAQPVCTQISMVNVCQLCLPCVHRTFARIFFGHAHAYHVFTELTPAQISMVMLMPAVRSQTLCPRRVLWSRACLPWKSMPALTFMIMLMPAMCSAAALYISN